MVNEYSKKVVSCINTNVKRVWKNRTHPERMKAYEHWQNDCVLKFGNANDTAILESGGIPYKTYFNITTTISDQAPQTDNLDTSSSGGGGGEDGGTSSMSLIIGLVVIISIIGGIVWLVRRNRG